MNRTKFRALRLTAVALILSAFGGFGQSPVSAEDADTSGGTSALQNPAAAAQEASAPAVFDGRPMAAAQALSDLTLGNLFSAGWDDDYAARTRETGTPDLPLLKALNNDLFRLFRTNFYENYNLKSTTRKDLVDFDGVMDWSFNRRLMIEVDGVYQWADGLPGHDEVSGGATGLLARLKLIDTESTELSFDFKVLSPNVGLAVFDTTVTFGVSGFEDLSYFFNVDRVGLYYHVLFDESAGPSPASAQPNDVQWDVSIAKTLTGPDAAVFKTLTVFEENYVLTQTDGPTMGRTYMTMTPGVRFNFGPCSDWKMGKSNAVILGIDLPVSNFQPWTSTFRLSYIKSF